VALNGKQFLDDAGFVSEELFRDGGEDSLEFRIVGLRGEGLGPVEGEVKVGAAVVDAAEFAAGRAVVVEKAAGGSEAGGDDSPLAP
jgi:hypothetical protein